jgi:hypothetical protein
MLLEPFLNRLGNNLHHTEPVECTEYLKPVVRVFLTDVPCGNRANLLKYKENLKNCCGYMYLFDSLEKTISNLRQ